MRFAVAGASGLIGAAVASHLEAEGHQVTRMVRHRDHAAAPGTLFWDPASGQIDREAIASHDAVANFAGEPPFSLWTPAKKRRIRSSRVDGTRLIAETLATIPESERPGLFVNMSAVGYYGSRPAEPAVDEAGPHGSGFMADVVRDWEAAAQPAARAGVRVVLLRAAPVLHSQGLPLGPLALATRIGLGATLGSGSQPFPWVTRDEIPRIVSFLVDRHDVSGPVNVAAPDHVTNRGFTDTVARVLERPRFLRVPATLLRLMGELGRELLGGSAVEPRRLQDAGYDWLDPALEPALRRLLPT